MEERTRLVLSEPKLVDVEHKGYTIKVKPYLSKKDQEELIVLYLKELREASHMDAEYFLLFSLLECCTNIELMHEEDDHKVASINIDDLYANWELVEKVRTAVRNYAEFYANLQKIVKLVTDKENSLNNAIQIGYTKLLELIDHLTQIDISDEQIAQVKDLIATVEKSPVLNEATRIFRQEEADKSTKKKVSPTPRKRSKADGRK